MFNLNHFYYFYLVAETGSVTAAAKVLHISQPALSKQLKVFERSLETKLFEKQGRGLRLTSAGLSLFGQARSIFEKAESLNREFVSTPSVQRERVRLGHGAGVDRSLASDLIGEFFDLYPAAEDPPALSVNALDGESLGRYLKEHVVDACLTQRRLAGTGLHIAASISSPICLMLPARLAPRLKGVNKRDLAAVVQALAQRWIIPTTNIRFRYDVESIAERNRIELRPILESDSILTIVRAVENGVGISLIPKHYLKAARDPRRIVALDRLKSISEERLFLWVRRAEKDRPFVKHLVRAFNAACR